MSVPVAAVAVRHCGEGVWLLRHGRLERLAPMSGRDPATVVAEAAALLRAAPDLAPSASAVAVVSSGQAGPEQVRTTFWVDEQDEQVAVLHSDDSLTLHPLPEGPVATAARALRRTMKPD